MALETMIDDDTTAAQTYELYGPTNYSTAEIADLVDKEIIKHRRHFNVPKAIMQPAAQFLNRAIWWMQTSADQVEREFLDQKIDKTAKTFADLGIEPAELTGLTYEYLVCEAGSSLYSPAVDFLQFVNHMANSTIPIERIPELCVLRFATTDRA